MSGGSDDLRRGPSCGGSSPASVRGPSERGLVVVRAAGLLPHVVLRLCASLRGPRLLSGLLAAVAAALPSLPPWDARDDAERRASHADRRKALQQELLGSEFRRCGVCGQGSRKIRKLFQAVVKLVA